MVVLWPQSSQLQSEIQTHVLEIWIFFQSSLQVHSLTYDTERERERERERFIKRPAQPVLLFHDEREREREREKERENNPFRCAHSIIKQRQKGGGEVGGWWWLLKEKETKQTSKRERKKEI